MDIIPKVVLNLTTDPITLVDVRGFQDLPIILYPNISLDLSTVVLDVDLAKSFHLKHLAAIGVVQVLSTFEVAQLQAGEQGIGNVIVIGTPIAGQVPTATSPTAATWQTPVAGASFVDEEVPAGIIDGINTIFSLANTPIAGSVRVYQNGLLQKAGGNDYSLSGNTISFTAAPTTGSLLIAGYRF